MPSWDQTVLEKSTLAYTLLAHPKYEVTKGDILLMVKAF